MFDEFFGGRQVFEFESYYDFDLILGTMVGHYTQVVLFNPLFF